MAKEYPDFLLPTRNPGHMLSSFSVPFYLKRCFVFITARQGLAGVAFAFLAINALALDPHTAANGYLLRGWQTETGLPSDKVRGICQTRDGYLWLATHQGLARFDGNRFTVFNSSTNPELLPGFGYSLVETANG